MKILICGSKGQLGSDCAEVLAARPPGHRSPIWMNSTSPTRPAVDRFVGRHQPEIIVNCAAYTRVDDCETQVGSGRPDQRPGPGHLAAAADTVGACLIHVSTDYVFDGDQAAAGRPTRKTTPPTRYRLTGEPSWPGKKPSQGHRKFYHPQNRLALWHRRTQFFKNHPPPGAWRPGPGNPGRQRPVWLADLVLSPGAPDCGPHRHPAAGRLYHATAEGSCTWYDLADLFLNAMQVPHRLVPCTTDAIPDPGPAARRTRFWKTGGSNRPGSTAWRTGRRTWRALWPAIETGL